MNLAAQADPAFQVRVFFHELGIQVGSGVPILKALDACKNIIRNTELHQAIDEMREALLSDEMPSAVLAKYPSLFTTEQQKQFIKGEETGELDLVSQQIGQETDQDFSILINRSLNRKPETILFLQELSQLLEPSDAALDISKQQEQEDLQQAIEAMSDPDVSFEPTEVPKITAEELAAHIRKAGLDLSEQGKQMVEQIALKIESGSSFREALAQYPEDFDAVILNVIEAGEVGNILGLLIKKMI